MPFAYYRSLSRKDQAIYDASDRIASIALLRPEALHPIVDIPAAGAGARRPRARRGGGLRLVLGIADSFHTQGFFSRESSLFKQLVREGVRDEDKPRRHGDTENGTGSNEPH